MTDDTHALDADLYLAQLEAVAAHERRCDGCDDCTSPPDERPSA